MYAKLINGELKPAPTNYRGIINYSQYPERMEEDGYKLVEYTPMPEDGRDEYDYSDPDNPVLVKEATKQYDSHWEEQDDRIVRVWDETPRADS